MILKLIAPFHLSKKSKLYKNKILLIFKLFIKFKKKEEIFRINFKMEIKEKIIFN